MFRLHDGTLVLSASDITAHLACPHLEQQRLAIARGERERPYGGIDAHAELTRRRGDAHEATAFARLSAEAGGDVADLSAEFDVRDRAALGRAAARTTTAVRAGVALIYQPTFFDGRWMGRADFLRRTGDGYEVLDTKLSRQVKPAMVHQLALYARLAGASTTAHLILGDGSVETVDLTRVAALHRRVVARVEGVTPRPTFPERIGHCDVCDFAAECRRHRVAVDDLSLVAGARRELRSRLAAEGVTTVAELARSEPQGFAVLHQQAALQVRSRASGEPCHRHLAPERARGYAVLPAPSPRDIFFDLEGDPFALPDRGLEYLWGWWTRDGYSCLWAHDEASERDAVRRFVFFVLDQLARDPGLHVYHYAPHERATLRSLATRYATCEEEVDELLRREVLVDLYAVVKQGMQVGEESYSIKSLERHHGFERSEHSIREGGGSIIAYEQWLETSDATLLEAIRAYNEEDCRSTLALRDWLFEGMRVEAAAEFAVDFDALREPEPQEPKPPPAWLPAVTAVVDRLEDAGQDLLAYLLLYHRREGKPSWWRYFDLRGKTSEELVDERDAIGELELATEVPPRPIRRSLAWTLHFPAQEFRLGDGSAEDPLTGDTYRVLEVHDDHLVLTRRNTDPPPEPRALIDGGPPSTEAQRNALLELSESILAGDGRFPAARALLERVPPRDPSLGAQLSGEVLPIQGPPGTGKTYRGARMIRAALERGLRVGVTAPSHAAIHNLLAEVETCVDFPFDGVYKGEGYRGAIETVDHNAAVTEDHQLVAGTAWLFSRPEHRGKFDLLFVDEAGQYSLADAVAAATATDSLVLLGDPQQLPQVTQATHPNGSGASVLEHLLGGRATIPPERGVLLDETWRMHPDICAFVSAHSYDDRLHSRPACARRRVTPGGAGLRLIEVEHRARRQASPEEAEAIAAKCRELLAGSTVTDDAGATAALRPQDILVVAPYNLAVRTIRERVPAGVRVGTVDSFQGRQAPVVFYAMTCSTGEDAPRGLDFLFSANRLNVAVSRAQCLAFLVYSPALLAADCKTVRHMTLVDGACRFIEMARG